MDALELVTHAIAAAERAGVNRAFFCALLLQESGFSPDAHSSAGAVGIAQFTLGTAALYGVDPFDWRDAMRGGATVIAGYLAGYAARYPDPYAAALAAYNAGPGAVRAYHGVPPYAETRAYVADIYDRWSQIERDRSQPERRLARDAFAHWVNRM